MIDAYQKQLLTDYINKAYNEDSAYIADKIAVFTPVLKDSWDVLDYGKQAMRLASDSLKRAVWAKYKRADFYAQIVATWKLEDRGLFAYILQEELDNADSKLNARQTKSDMIVEMMKLEQEIAVSTVLQSDVIASAALSGTSKFSDPNSNPLNIIDTYRAKARLAGWVLPDSIVLSREVLNALKANPAIQAQFRGLTILTDANITEQVLAGLFGFKNVYVSDAMFDATAETVGQITNDNDYTSVWWKDLVMFYKGMWTAASRTFLRKYGRKNGIIASTFPPTAEQKATEHIADWVVVENKYDLVIADKSLAYRIEDVIA